MILLSLDVELFRALLVPFSLDSRLTDDKEQQHHANIKMLPALLVLFIYFISVHKSSPVKMVGHVLYGHP